MRNTAGGLEAATARGHAGLLLGRGWSGLGSLLRLSQPLNSSKPGDTLLLDGSGGEQGHAWCLRGSLPTAAPVVGKLPGSGRVSQAHAFF